MKKDLKLVECPLDQWKAMERMSKAVTTLENDRDLLVAILKRPQGACGQNNVEIEMANLMRELLALQEAITRRCNY